MSVQGELKGGWVYMSLWEWNTMMPKWCLALTRPPFQQEQNIYNTGFTAETSLYNPNLGPVPQPCSASQRRLWITSKTIHSQCIYVFTLCLGNCFICSQMAVYLVVCKRFIWLWEFGKEKQAAMTSCATPAPPPFPPSIFWNATIIQQSAANQVCRVHY